MSSEHNLAFGAVLKMHRKQAGLSQERLAELAELTTNFVGELERGRKSPTITTLRRLAAALCMAGSDLLKEAEIEEAKRENEI